MEIKARRSIRLQKCRKRILIYITGLMCIVLMTACSSSPKKNFVDYLNNTLEYFVASTGIEVELVEENSYTNEEKGIQLEIKNNIMSLIRVTKKVRGYGIDGIQVGDSKKKVDKQIKSKYEQAPEMTQNDKDQTTTYAYKEGNCLLKVVYNSENEVSDVSAEIVEYTVTNTDTNQGIESQIAKDEIMLSVGNIDVPYSEVMIYLRTAQQIYETEFGNEVFSYDLYGNGTTIGSVLKQEVLKQIIQLEVINVVANEQGITLNDDEMLEVHNYVDEFMNRISESDKEKYGITEELATRVFATNVTAQKLYETVTIDVDTDVSDEEAQQARIYKLFVRNYGMDSKGNKIQLQPSEQKEVKKKVKELRKQALETQDFKTFAQANSEDDTIEYVVGRSDLSEAQKEVVFSLKDGEVSKVIEDEDGYTIIYCVTAYDEDATRQVKEKIIEQRRSDLFVQLYTEWYSKYEVKVNMDLWNRLELTPLDSMK